MFRRISIVTLFCALIVIAPSLFAGPCVRCENLACVSWTSGYVNCGSNGSTCLQWDACSNEGKDDGEEPVIEGRLDSRCWRLARVEVTPAPKETTAWQLASVRIEPSRERAR